MDFKANPKTDFKPARKLSKEEAREEMRAFHRIVEKGARAGTILYVAELKFDLIPAK